MLPCVLGDMFNVTLEMTSFSRGYTGHVVQHKGQHLLSCTTPPPPHTHFVLGKTKYTQTAYMALKTFIYLAFYPKPGLFFKIYNTRPPNCGLHKYRLCRHFGGNVDTHTEYCQSQKCIASSTLAANNQTSANINMHAPITKDFSWLATL